MDAYFPLYLYFCTHIFINHWDNTSCIFLSPLPLSFLIYKYSLISRGWLWEALTPASLRPAEQWFMGAQAGANLALGPWQYKWWQVSGTADGGERLSFSASVSLCLFCVLLSSLWWRHHHYLLGVRIVLDRVSVLAPAFDGSFNFMPNFSQHREDQCCPACAPRPSASPCCKDREQRRTNVHCWVMCTHQDI